MRKLFTVICLLFVSFQILGQGGVISGRVFNPINNDPIPFANILVLDTELGTVSDENGNYRLENITPGLYNVRASFVGFRSKTTFEVQVTLAKSVQLDFGLLEEASELGEVLVSSEFTRSEETPLSVRKLNANEIERYPGGNRDISRVIQSLPGVASTASFRNDIIIRGGAPSENKFYIDEIEVPVINHFATQGSSGGPVGILNVNLIKNVDLITGGFPSNRMNSLSSFFEFQLKEGRRDKMATQLTVGASELTLSNEGPLGDKTTYLVSARRSYLQGLFRLIGLPFLPTFNDFQVKTTTKINDKTELTFIGVGAIDDFVLNFDTPKNELEEDRENRLFLLESLPISSQWNYATGLKLKKFRDNGFWTFVLSRNMLNNRSFKYARNDESNPENLLFDYTSQESENKFRAENSVFGKGFTLKYGVNYEFARYLIRDFDRGTLAGQGETINVNDKSFFNSYGAFISGSKNYFQDRLLVTGGVRLDGSDFGKTAQNPLNQISPRVSVSYQLKPNLFLTGNTGVYYQKPPYTALGYRNNEGELTNQINDIRFIRSAQVIAGIEKVMPEKKRRITAEAFYKHYSNYPSSIRNGIALANLGADFGVIGNEPINSNAQGRAYGLELLAQQRLFQNFYGIAAVTLVRSEFTNPNTVGYLPSSWDNRFIVSLTAGRRFGKNWEIGGRWRFLGGTPYTPFDLASSSLISNWDLRGQGQLDFDQINAVRLPAFHQLDLRIDKKYFFEKWSLNWYFDIQNAYNFQAEQAPRLVPVRDGSGQLIVRTDDPSRYQLRTVENPAGTILPTIGLIIEF
ncbi:ferric aerobactin receptor [Rhodonellum psychrophilum GCM71 = DSM 17998]|uniref:Ferric aerobactin receptor n=2 Tax=Rhodonellum TaxID=336827 RepID=U5BQM9_9BACT|nr:MULTISPECIES: TonB-dependent receptor [Rhodonellum]ERM82865.1 ferric aerobactin receptor [Rhodonellum psychrophilum GCM71 = DSM 17998]SDY46481.1 Outer membrane receptor proteins, mostly Fe transport [Rhodonellum ikkaensis]